VDFTPGETVQMKSGGPVMTVERIAKDQKNQEDVVVCTWFETVGKRQILQKEQFSPIVLEKYEPSFGLITTRI
jgi:uncharacterized protein YodC (DUF2158 family)